MAIPTAYLTSAGKLRDILDDVQKAGVPERFTYEFLKQIGHPSSANRPVIAVLKTLGFLTDSGQPTERYRRFKDPAQSKAVMAEAVRDAYADVFTVDQEANLRTTTQLKGIFARLSDKGDSVNEKMAATFKALTDLADFRAPATVTVSGDGAGDGQIKGDQTITPPPEQKETSLGAVVLRHDVHVHLPISTDIAVYDAIFRAIRENLG
jgi:Family of unknown function (DUF5343)